MAGEITVGCTMDMKAFSKTLAEYMRWNRRAPAEIVNTKLYFIAGQAVKHTKKAEASRIYADLNRVATHTSSRNHASLTVGQMIALSRFWKANKEGKRIKGWRKRGSGIGNLNMLADKIYKARVRTITFLCVGWKQAMKNLLMMRRKNPDDYQFSQQFEDKEAKSSVQKTRAFGAQLGDSVAAKLNTLTVRGSITNAVGGKGRPSRTATRIHKLLVVGLDKAINSEIASMKQYIDRKAHEFARKRRA